MGQKIREDKIGTLSHNAGSISLAASYLTIGGQQYSTGALSRTISDDVTLTANSLYMIYAVLVSGVPVIRISSNVNSVGPAGFTYWKLVGALYSNNSSAFGSFVNIEGVPETTEIAHSASLVSSGGGSITLNATAKVDPVGYWKRKGEVMEYLQIWKNGSGGAASGSAGAVWLSIPTNLPINSTNRPSDGNFGAFMGLCHGYNLAEGAVANGVYTQGTHLFYTNFASGSAYQVADLAANFGINLQLFVRVVGWSNTPLKDS